MEQIGEIMKKRLNQHKLGGAGAASEVLFNAQKFLRIYFEEDPDAVKPLMLKNAVLWLGVKNSVWAQEFQGVADKLLRQLQLHYGTALIKKIRTKDLTNY